MKVFLKSEEFGNEEFEVEDIWEALEKAVSIYRNAHSLKDGVSREVGILLEDSDVKNKGGMKEFEGSFKELNGEQEYHYSYLIRARTEESARKKLNKFLRTWYQDLTLVEGDSFEYGHGERIVRVIGVSPATETEFSKSLLEWYIL